MCGSCRGELTIRFWEFKYLTVTIATIVVTLLSYRRNQFEDGQGSQGNANTSQCRYTINACKTKCEITMAECWRLWPLFKGKGEGNIDWRKMRTRTMRLVIKVCVIWPTASGQDMLDQSVYRIRFISSTQGASQMIIRGSKFVFNSIMPAR